ncbi:MAG: MFS transporter [Candidatus Limnocylindria bacterium]
MLRLQLGTLSLFTGYHALLVLTPLYLSAIGANELVIGTATGAFMLLAVGGHIAAPSLVPRWGTRRPFLLALVGTSLAALAHVPITAAAAVVALSAVRGGIYGLGAVISATAVAHLALPAHRAGALARYGFAAALPGLLGSTAAVFVAEEVGFTAAFLAVAAVSLLPAPLLLERDVPSVASAPEDDAGMGPLGPAALTVALIFAGFAMVYGAALTFVPVHLTRAESAAYPFVLATALGLAAFRLAGGGVVKHVDPAATLGAGLLLGCLAMALLAFLPPGVAPLGGLVFGAGFGLGGTATHSMLTTTTQWDSLGRANAVFNVAWSGGMGLGAAAFGVVATALGVISSYLLAAGWHLLLGATLLIWLAARARRQGHRPAGQT